MNLNIKPVYKRAVALGSIAITALYALPWTNDFLSVYLDKAVVGIPIIALPAALSLVALYLIYQRDI